MPLARHAEPFLAAGDDLGILLVHGITGSPAAVRPWAQFLAAAGHTVNAPRLPGHGTHWQDLNRTTWQDWYTEVESAASWLGRRCTRVVVMGISSGGALALRLAEEHPVAGLVAVNPIVQTERRDWAYLTSLRAVLRSWPNTHDDIKRPGVTESAYERLPLQAAHSMTRLWSVTRGGIDRVTCPVLLLRSADDHVAEPSNVTWLLANLRSPEVTEVMLEDSYHVATLDNDAATIFEASLAFARRVSGR